MPHSMHLPVPDADANAHSARVVEIIRQRIAEAGGWIDFADYMNLALYAPGFGYYSAGAQKFGAAGDFVTAPEISPLFAGCVARTFIDATFEGDRARRGPPTILELGAGTGAMAAGILQTLQRLDALPEQYLILEISADLRERQRRLIGERVPNLVDLVSWHDELPPSPIVGVIVANEVLDALPVTRFEMGERGRFRVLGVEHGETGFAWSPRPADDRLSEQLREIAESLDEDWPPGYVSEFCPSLHGFMGGLSDALEQGLILLIDYGLPRSDYYRPGRYEGTLACHYRHRRHDDPFLYPGLQDITAWVDFTRVADSASDVGLDVLGFTTQAHFLLAGGVEEEYALLRESSGSDREVLEQTRIAAGLKTLMLPGQMGETFKLIALGRRLERGPSALCDHDLSHLL